MPLYQALLITATIVSGGLFYDEFGIWGREAMAQGQPELVVGFMLGVVTLLAGIVLVALSPTPQKHVDSSRPPLLRDAGSDTLPRLCAVPGARPGPRGPRAGGALDARPVAGPWTR